MNTLEETEKERKIVADKLQALQDYISSPEFNNATPAQRDMFYRQRAATRKLLQVLTIRVRDFRSNLPLNKRLSA